MSYLSVIKYGYLCYDTYDQVISMDWWHCHANTDLAKTHEAIYSHFEFGTHGVIYY